MIKGYYFITDSDLSKNGNVSDVEKAVEAGVTVVQHRRKLDNTDAFIEEAKILKKICKGKSLFIINDRVGIALSVDADGVHLGRGDMPYDIARNLLGKEKIIGVTVHDVKEAIQAENKGADYLGVSPIFSTATKSDAGKPCGIEVIKEIKKNCKVPIVAIGGIALNNAKDVVEAGADAICAISTVVTKDDIKKEIKKFQSLFNKQ